MDETQCLLCQNQPKLVPHQLCTHCDEKFRREHVIDGEAALYGLSARMAIQKIIEDADNPAFVEQRAWHRRRIAFLCDCIVLALNDGFFYPVPQQSIQNLTDMASAVWLTDNHASRFVDIWKELQTLYPPEKLTGEQQRAREILELLLSSPDDLYLFEIPDIIGEFFHENVWVQLFRKHFPDVIQQWVAR